MHHISGTIQQPGCLVCKVFICKFNGQSFGMEEVTNMNSPFGLPPTPHRRFGRCRPKGELRNRLDFDHLREHRGEQNWSEMFSHKM
jgi:hypothetical protein